jgi:type II secretory pathway component PulJ
MDQYGSQGTPERLKLIQLEKRLNRATVIIKKMLSNLVACRGENVTAAATTKGRKQVYAWRVPAI